MNFWQALKNKKDATGVPFFAVAPMADVTDAAFRRLIAHHGKPDVMWTEFVSANGLMSGGRKVLERDLVFSEMERSECGATFFIRSRKNGTSSTTVCRVGF